MRQISQLNGQLYSLDLKVRDSQEIKREIASQESNYQTYLRKLEEARISDDMDRQKMVALKVIEEAKISKAKTRQKSPEDGWWISWSNFWGLYACFPARVSLTGYDNTIRCRKTTWYSGDGCYNEKVIDNFRL